MQKFKFKLDGLLKVREFSEKKIKIELGQLLKEINRVNDLIAKLNRDLDDAYHEQEKILSGHANGNLLKFFPYFVTGKKADIKNQEALKLDLSEKYKLKIHELAIARGEVKVLENFKDKKKTEWVKEKDKKEQMSIEELLMIRRGSAE